MENKYYINKQNILTENVKKAIHEMNYNVRTLSREVDIFEEKIDKVLEFIKENFTNLDGSIWHEDMKIIYKILGGDNNGM